MATTTTETLPRVRKVPADSRPTVSLLGWAISFLDEPADNDDALMTYEIRGGPGTVVPPHTEQNHEAFYVLEGEVELELDGESTLCGPGDFASIAPGVPHSVRNAGQGWCRILITVAPGSQHRRFFEALGEPLEPGADPTPLTEPPDFARVDAAGKASGIHFLPPPDAA